MDSYILILIYRQPPLLILAPSRLSPTAIRVGEKRKMIHIPQALEATARQWVATYQESWQLMEKISQACLERFFKDKEKERGKHG